MKIGIIREGKNPPDKRVPFTPKQLRNIVDEYDAIEVVVQKSEVRGISDGEYENEGISVVDNIDEVDVVFGVKEINIVDLIPNKTHFFFSHTIKEQPYNRDLLKSILKKNITLIDYECLVNPNGIRILGFGRYAGIVGTYNTLLAYGKRMNQFDLKSAHNCHDKKELYKELEKVKLPNSFKIVITGLGRVAGGTMEILDYLKIKQVSPEDFISQKFNEPVYTQLSVNEYFKKPDNFNFEREEAYSNPERFESNFMTYAKHADMYISCHYWDSKGPLIFNKTELASSDFKIRTIGDISCDIAGPIPSTVRPSTIDDPIYYVNRFDCVEINNIDDNSITVMAVDNLPCELPRDASEDFGKELFEKVIPALANKDKDGLLERATIAKGGELTPKFSYLEAYVNGK